MTTTDMDDGSQSDHHSHRWDAENVMDLYDISMDAICNPEVPHDTVQKRCSYNSIACMHTYRPNRRVELMPDYRSMTIAVKQDIVCLSSSLLYRTKNTKQFRNKDQRLDVSSRHGTDWLAELPCYSKEGGSHEAHLEHQECTM
jgi:hypothetical protein